jgi:hypothetical protein
MEVDVKILQELSRFNSINKYIMEQELPAPPADPAAAPVDPLADPTASAPVDPLANPMGTTPPAEATTTPPAQPTQPVDVSADPDVEKVGDEDKNDENTKEVEVTDLVKSQDKIEKKQEEYFENLFNHLQSLEDKLGEMDNIVNKLNDLETKIEKNRIKTPEEKMQLRTLDSGPFSQKLTDFFEDKVEDFEKLGRDEYILTKDDVEDFSPNEIKKTFRNFEDEGMSF